FAEYAEDEALRLVPGHSYVLDPRPDLDAGGSEPRIVSRARRELVPLLRDYLDERLVGSASEAVLGLVDRIITKVPEAAGTALAHVARPGVVAIARTDSSGSAAPAANCSSAPSTTVPRSPSARMRSVPASAAIDGLSLSLMLTARSFAASRSHPRLHSTVRSSCGCTPPIA